MVLLDSVKILEYIDIENINNEQVTLKINGEQLIQDIYEDIKIDIKDENDQIQVLTCMDAPFIDIFPNEIFNEKDCKQLAIEIKNILNNRIRSQLKL